MNKNLRQILKNIILPRIPQLLLILLLLLITTGLQTLSPWPYKILLDNVLGHELVDPSSFIGLLLKAFDSPAGASVAVIILYFSIITLSRIFDFLYYTYNNYVIQRITKDFSAACFHNLTLLDYSYFRRHTIGNYLYKLSSDTTAPADIVESSLLPLFTSSLYLIVTFVIMAQINIQMATISLISLPILSISYYYFNRHILETSQTLERKNGLLYTFLEQIISQLKIIQAYAAERFSLHNYETKVWETLLAELKYYRLNILLTLSNGLIIGLTYTLILYIGTKQVTSGTISIGLLMVFIFYLDNLVSPVISIIDNLASLKHNLTRLKNTNDIFDTKNQLIGTGIIKNIEDTTITFDKVTLTDKDQVLLDNITFSTKPGVLNVIAGESGSGKSTIFLMLSRLAGSWTGEITLGGKPISDYDLSTLRTSLGYVPQETELFDNTISDHISFGYPHATDESIVQAARMACAEKFILSKPQSYSSKVGEHGNLLSGGERQRLLLARAYLRHTPILLLDEIFSGQDKATQKTIMSNLRALLPHTNVILITHTFDLIESTDNVIVMNNGKISHQGSYLKLKNILHQRR